MIYSVHGITLAYPRMPPVVREASFELDAGDILTILGPNGAGKSTLLNSLMGLHELDGRRIEVGGKDLGSLSPKELARSVAYVQQHQAPVFAFSVGDFVAMGRAPHLSVYGKPRRRDRKAVEGREEFF